MAVSTNVSARAFKRTEHSTSISSISRVSCYYTVWNLGPSKFGKWQNLEHRQRDFCQCCQKERIIPESSAKYFCSKRRNWVWMILSIWIGKIAVHCHAGHGRTGTAIAACLMRTRGLTPRQAVELVRSKRYVTICGFVLSPINVDKLQPKFCSKFWASSSPALSSLLSGQRYSYLASTSISFNFPIRRVYKSYTT